MVVLISGNKYEMDDSMIGIYFPTAHAGVYISRIHIKLFLSNFKKIQLSRESDMEITYATHSVFLATLLQIIEKGSGLRKLSLIYADWTCIKT
uniref:Uncharacterized protein n=1 Tax=Rhabditophanes sp. KR3021 TaxID=114890 RepID=A0AC35TYW7_9BILA